MEVNAIVFVGGDLDSEGRSAAMRYDMDLLYIEYVLEQLPQEITSVILLADRHQPKIEDFSLPIIYVGSSPKGFLSDLHKVLLEQSDRRFLVLSGADDRFTNEHCSQLLDHSARLPHMMVISTHQGEILPFPMILPAGIAEDIGEFLSDSAGSVADWLEQSVFIECELTDLPYLL
ncbi:hypothetical protein ACMXYW_12275 [Neptuniibacter sp. QD48_55]|uniref:hypothetical protein n=1 Tax=Neptuniibacter sp. QD48_55 TaxID=3398212 RepID=UPI0039F544C1